MEEVRVAAEKREINLFLLAIRIYIILYIYITELIVADE